MLLGVAPAPTPTPTVYHPTLAEAPSGALSSGVYGWVAGTSQTGAPVDGFALSLTADHYSFRLDEDLWFAVELRNVSGFPMRTSFSASDTIYTFTMRDLKTGREISQSAIPGFGPPATYNFPPRTSLYLWFTG
jgi:hypothetical protein